MFFLDVQELKILFLSALPLTELRLSIPLAVAWGINPLKSFFLACLGNFIPIIPILLFLEPLNKLLSRVPLLNGLFQSLLQKTRRKGQQVEKYGAIGLFLFVAVPLPGTGVYSGAALAFLFGIRFWLAFPALTLGMVTAGIAVTMASAGAKELAGYIYDFEYLIIGLFILGIIFYLFSKRHKK